MNLSSFSRIAAPAALTLILAGCAAAGGRHANDAAAGSYGGGTGTGMGMGAQGGMDMTSMCEMHKKNMAGKSVAERQAMIDQHMESMSPERRAQMREMMANCR